MQKLIAALALSGASAFVAPTAARAGVAVSETKADLEKLAVELNPIVASGTRCRSPTPPGHDERADDRLPPARGDRARPRAMAGFVIN